MLIIDFMPVVSTVLSAVLVLMLMCPLLWWFSLDYLKVWLTVWLCLLSIQGCLNVPYTIKCFFAPFVCLHSSSVVSMICFIALWGAASSPLNTSLPVVSWQMDTFTLLSYLFYTFLHLSCPALQIRLTSTSAENLRKLWTEHKLLWCQGSKIFMWLLKLETFLLLSSVFYGECWNWNG